MLLVVAVGVLALQALLVTGYLAVKRDDPIVLNPDRGILSRGGVMMAVYCGRGGRGKDLLDKIPPDGWDGPWSKGRTLPGDCDIWYHHPSSWRPCEPGHCRLTFDERPCRNPCT